MSAPAVKPVPTAHGAAGNAEAQGPRDAVLVLELLLILLVIRLFHIEERRGLLAVTCLAGAGFLVHRRLPVVWRPGFFSAVSLASFPLVFAWPHIESGWQRAAVEGLTQTGRILGLGLPLIGICHLPVRFAVRAALIAAAGMGLAWWRYDAAGRDDGGGAFWPVLGSIFMFRLWIYLRELRRETAPVPWPRRLSYFFLLPNACFPFFPIVDYRRFRDGYVPDPSGTVAQRGLSWVLRGLIHLLLYRAVKTFLLPGPLDLIDAEYVALFLVTNYALYLRISGYFHIITGLLHLFGFDLPRTHDRYFLASGLSDIWRRINIYWKDFLNEHVFLPTFFALRGLPRPAAVVLSVAAVFVATWLLHSWQAFWLTGDFPLEGRDAALWLSAAALVAVNSLWQYRTAIRGTDRNRELTAAVAFRRSLQVAGTFLTVSFFWACWTDPGFLNRLSAIAAAGGFRLGYLAKPASIVFAALAAGTGTQLAAERLRHSGVASRFPLEHSPAVCLASLLALVAAGSPEFYDAIGRDMPRPIARVRAEPRAAAELGEEIAGYYEVLAEPNLQSAPFVSAGEDRSGRFVHLSDAARKRDDILETELIPGWEGQIAGVPFRVNRWGMRDDDVPRRKPPGTYRVALVGSSVVAGYGVAEDADFESLLERRVNAAAPAGPGVEFLNFGTGGYVALQWAAALPEKVYPFDPDAVYYVAHQGELLGSSRHLAKCVELGYPLPYPCLGEVVRRAGVTEELSWGITEVRLQPFARQILGCIYRGMADECRRQGAAPVWVYLPMPGVAGVPEDMGATLGAIARDSGFVVIDLSGWDAGAEEEVLLDGHHHANALGHRLLADRLFGALRAQPAALPYLSGK